MPLNFKIVCFFTSLYVLLYYVESKSYFGIGKRYFGDQLLSRDKVENHHTGLTELPVIAFEYAVKEPITYIEIMSEVNVLANVHFSYYDAIINGTVEAITSNIKPESFDQSFAIYISIYGFKDTTTESFLAAKVLRPEQYEGPLTPQPEPGEVDHMEIKPIFSRQDSGETQIFEDVDDDDESNDNIENATDPDEETFESMDLFSTLGHRQKGDELLFESYQTSEPATSNKTEHVVTFYFVDDVHITFIEFVLIDYKVNKTPEEIEKGYFISFNHYTPGTIKAVIRDYKTTSLVARIKIYGYKGTLRPHSYVSYIPKEHQIDNLFFSRFLTTESPEMQLRTQLNTLHRDANGLPNIIPADFYRSQHEDVEPGYVITSITQVPNSGFNIFYGLHAMKPAIFVVLSSLWSVVF